MAGYVPALRFRALTGLYDPVVRATTREAEFKRRLLDRAAIGPGDRVLDLACGTGTLAIEAKQRTPGAELVGVDGDPEMLARAREKAAAAGLEIELDEGLSTDLPYDDATFDRVLSTLFFHHLDLAGKRTTIAEIARVLRPGGELHVADWGRPSDPLMARALLAGPPARRARRHPRELRRLAARPDRRGRPRGRRRAGSPADPARLDGPASLRGLRAASCSALASTTTSPRSTEARVPGVSEGSMPSKAASDARIFSSSSKNWSTTAVP